MDGPSTPQDRAAWRADLRRRASELSRPRPLAVPDPDDPETWAFDGPPDYSGTMPDLPTVDPETRESAATEGAEDG